MDKQECEIQSVQIQEGQLLFSEKCRLTLGASNITSWLCVCFNRAVAWGDEDSPLLISMQMTSDGHSITSTVSHNNHKPSVFSPC